MATIASPSRKPGRAAHLRRDLEDQRTVFAPDAALGLNGRRQRDELQLLEHGELLGSHGGKVPSHDPARRVLISAAERQVDRVADMQVELDRFPVEIVPKPAAIRLFQHVARAQAGASRGPIGSHRRDDHAALALPVSHGRGAFHFEANPRPPHGAGSDDLIGDA